jgi:pimeloyl-ACP methyl ester carboxylesterase
LPSTIRGSPIRLVLIDSIVYDSFPEPGIARLKDPAWDGILGAPDFDLKKGLTKGFTQGMVHADRITAEMFDAYERPFRGVEGRLAYLRAARALRTEELASRMDAVEKLALPTLVVWMRRRRSTRFTTVYWPTSRLSEPSQAQFRPQNRRWSKRAPKRQSKSTTPIFST